MSLRWMEGGSRPYTKVLIANRGEIACRIIRACRELGLKSVAIHAANDRESLFVEMADQAVELKGDSLAETYLNIKQILEIAGNTQAGAIHPGFGFLSERSDFANAVQSAGLVWIGPSAQAIESMGDKMTARRLMRKAGVPVIPGEEIDEVEEQAALAAIHEASQRVGLPLMLKASAGGGGKGMRMVEDFSEVRGAAMAARREALTAFGDGRVYVERMITSTRHIEIQILADSFGEVIHLCERECSVQRRHQKVLEEAPSPVVSENLRAQMGAAAVNAAKAVSYEGAGTVEFLVTPHGTFHFLEMNTRIQVEHPITECITGIDLVCEQLRIAAGLPLGREQSDIKVNGHAIEVRIYAEDASNGFLPVIGPLAVWSPPTGPGIRLDSGVRQGDEVTPSYDPMLAKLVVHASDRKAAIRRMKSALSEFIILGTTTNIDFLQDLISHPAYRAGKTTTDFIETNWPNGWSNTQTSPEVIFTAAIAQTSGVHSKISISTDAQFGDQIRNDPMNPFIRIGRSFP
ncbi:MAG: acetyl-CoA carboxylase biotin carboxylase subunit [Candidatus Poseidoniales archaeon]|jgi:acetyl-CoA carboxylase biotin carboxylase subunit